MKKIPTGTGVASTRKSHSSQYLLRLYVSGHSLKSERAIENIKAACEQHLKGRYDLEVIDIHHRANLARDEQIVAVPTLIKRLPLPLQRLVGDMSNLHHVLFGLDLRIQEYRSSPLHPNPPRLTRRRVFSRRRASRVARVRPASGPLS